MSIQVRINLLHMNKGFGEMVAKEVRATTTHLQRSYGKASIRHAVRSLHANTVVAEE